MGKTGAIGWESSGPMSHCTDKTVSPCMVVTTKIETTLGGMFRPGIRDTRSKAPGSIFIRRQASEHTIELALLEG